MRCNQCESLYINGVFCHETGCPNTHKIYDKEEQEWRNPEPNYEDDDFDEWANFMEFDTFDPETDEETERADFQESGGL